MPALENPDSFLYFPTPSKHKNLHNVPALYTHIYTTIQLYKKKITEIMYNFIQMRNFKIL